MTAGGRAPFLFLNLFSVKWCTMLAYGKGIYHFTMNTHLSLLVTLTWLRITDNSQWKTFDNLDLSLVTSRRDHLWDLLTIWLAICTWYLHENNITLKYHNTFVTVTSDRRKVQVGIPKDRKSCTRNTMG